jgi:predicted ribonuclease YlaK
MNYIFDTCALLSNPSLVEEKMENKEDKVIIPHTVFLELTNLKKGYLDSSRLSREVLNLIAEKWIYEPNFEIYGEKDHYNIKSYSIGIDNDGVIFEIALRYRKLFGESTLLTADKDLVIYCRNHNLKNEYVRIEIERIGGQKILNSEFKGYRIFRYGESEDVDQKITKHYANISNQNFNENVFELYPNEYICIEGTKGSSLGRWDSKKKRIVKLQTSDRMLPKNMQQAFAIDMMLNKESPIKIIAGGFGSGKSFLATQYAWYESIGFSGKKIMFVRNPMGDTDSADVGFLKGDLLTKLMPYFMPIVDNLEGGEVEFMKKMDQGKLELMIPLHAKGRSLKNTTMVVDEAEDLTIKTLKLLGSRIGENSEIIFSGDYSQSERAYLNNNGLVHFIDISKGLDLVSCVVLEEDVRSEASKIFADM